MQRDKKGRFVKKAELGMVASLNKSSGVTMPKKLKYNYKNGLIVDENGNVLTAAMVANTDLYEKDLLLDVSPKLNMSNTNSELSSTSFYTPKEITKPTLTTSTPIRYNFINGLIVDEDGNTLTAMDISDTKKYTRDVSLKVPLGSIKTTQEKTFDPVKKESQESQEDINENSNDVEESSGMNFTTNIKKKSFDVKSIDRNKLADFIELTRSGIGAAVNNKIADRAIEAEKPFLQDVSESHRSVYGDYRAQIQGEKAAAKLRNMASKPLTSDGALQQQMMLEAQLRGQEFIDEGNAKDDALRRQTQEVAWQQEKENRQQRQAVAMQNRQAMLMSQKNKVQIENARDSANFSQIIEPILHGKEERLRYDGAKQEYYQDYYDDALVSQDVQKNFRDGMTAEQKIIADKLALEGIDGVSAYVGTDKQRERDFLAVSQILNNEILRRKAALKGVRINSNVLSNPTPNQFGTFSSGVNLFPIHKRGGRVSTKRQLDRDKDRNAKARESSKKLAARLLEQAIDSLYSYDQIELIARPKKSKKRKYQAGGGLPFVGVSSVSPASSSKFSDNQVSKKDDDEKGISTKDVLELLKDMDGLPSDMNVIVQSLRNFTLMEGSNLGTLASSSSIASRYIKLMHQMKMAKFNKEEYTAAFNQLKGNGGLNEYAITSEGKLIGSNADGDFEYFSVDDVRKGTHVDKGYSLLTNSNLLYLRANSADAAFNPGLTSVAQSGIGMETVNKMILDVINNLGTMEDSQEGYVKTKTGDIIKGLNEFYKAIDSANGDFNGTVDDLYKYKYVTKNQVDQIKKALTYVYQTLPANAKTLLKLKSDGSDLGAVQLIEMLISSKESTKAQIDIDLIGGKSHTKTSSGATKDSTDLKTSLPLNVLKGIGGVDSYLNIDRGDGIHMSVRGTVYNLIKTPSGESIVNTSILEMLAKSGLQGIVKDMRKIQFGDQVISPESLQYITYNNSGVTRALLPIKSDGTVRLDLLEEYNKAEAEVDLLEDKSKENIQKIYESHKLLDLLNADGSYNMSKFAPFMVTEGYTTDALSGLSDSAFVKEFKGDSDGAVALMENSLAVGSGKNIQVPDIDTKSWWNPGDWFGWTDKIYKGVIYIPITNNVNTAVLGANQTLDYEEAMSQEEKYQNFEKMTNQRSTSADILNI